MTEEQFLETYPTYTDAEGVEWDSYEDYQIAKFQARYLASRRRRNIFADEVPHVAGN